MSLSRRLGFNGMFHEPGTRWQLLGNGRRAYNPVLMRFHSPDALSPFGAGGLNAYAYCRGDPINHADPSGQFSMPLLMQALGLVGGLGAVGFSAFAGSSDDAGGGDGLTPWIIGGAIAGVALLTGAGMAGRQQLMKLRDSSGRPPGGAWANRAGGASAGTAVQRQARSASPPRMAPPTPPGPSAQIRTRSPSPDVGVNFYQRDTKTGMVLKSMSDLPSPVREKIIAIREHGPRGRFPDPSKVQRAKPFDNASGQLPHDPSGKFYHRYPVHWGTAHNYTAWRIVTASSFKGGIHAVYVTPNHYDNFFKVRDWSRNA